MSISTTKHRDAKYIYYTETIAPDKHKNGPPSQRKYFKVADPQSEQRSEFGRKDIQHRFLLSKRHSAVIFYFQKKIQLQSDRNQILCPRNPPPRKDLTENIGRTKSNRTENHLCILAGRDDKKKKKTTPREQRDR